MANKIQLRRGVKANLPTLSVGEPAFTTDTKQLFIGDGNSNIEYAKKTDIPSTMKNPNALTINLNGTSQGAYDGSTAKSVNITPSGIGTYTKSEIDTKVSTINTQLVKKANKDVVEYDFLISNDFEAITHKFIVDELGHVTVLIHDLKRKDGTPLSNSTIIGNIPSGFIPRLNWFSAGISISEETGGTISTIILVVQNNGSIIIYSNDNSAHKILGQISYQI